MKWNEKSVEFDNSILVHLVLLLTTLSLIITVEKKASLAFLLLLTILFIFFKVKVTSRKIHQKLQLERTKWFIDLISGEYNKKNIDESLPTHQLKNAFNYFEKNYFNRELGFEVPKIKRNFLIPDIEESEKVVQQLEFTNALYLTILLTLPLGYSLFLTMYTDSIVVMILSYVIIISIIEILTVQLRNSYRLTDWIHYYEVLTTIGERIIQNPYLGYLELNNIYSNPFTIELGIFPESKTLSPVGKLIESLHKLLINSDKEISEFIFENFMFSTRQLPITETLHNQKWLAFKHQFIIFSFVVIFFNVVIIVLFELTGILLGQLQNTNFENIFPLLKLSRIEISFIFALTLNLLSILSQTYIKPKNKNRYVVIWAIEGLWLYLLLSFILKTLIV